MHAREDRTQTEGQKNVPRRVLQHTIPLSFQQTGYKKVINLVIYL